MAQAPTPNLESLRLSGPEKKIQHVESGTPPALVKHEDHLPTGVDLTDEQRQKKWFVGSIDQGTTSSRFLIFDGEGTPVASHQIEFENLYPESG